jgi:hypothetical protein
MCWSFYPVTKVKNLKIRFIGDFKLTQFGGQKIGFPSWNKPYLPFF